MRRQGIRVLRNADYEGDRVHLEKAKPQR